MNHCKSITQNFGHFQKLLFILFSLIILLSISLIRLLTQYYNLQKKLPHNGIVNTNNFIFKDFINNEKQTILAIGYIYTFCEFEDEINSIRFVRNRLINSDQDLKEYMTSYNIPEQNIWAPTWDSVPFSSLEYYRLIQSIYPLSSRTSLTANISSIIDWAELTNNNIIYIGHYHNLGKLDQFYRSDHFNSLSLNNNYSELTYNLAENLKKYETSDTNLVHITNKNQLDVLFTISHKDTSVDSNQQIYEFVYDEKSGYVKDYVILTKLPGPGTNEILFVISFHQIGRLQVINMLVNPTHMSKFEKQIKKFVPSKPKYFEMLIEVKGYEETPMEMNILHFYSKEANFKLNFNAN